MNLLNISPLDGRYQNKTKDLAPIFSEYGLSYYRLLVEIKWFISLSENKSITELPKLEPDSIKYLEDIYKSFDIKAAEKIKEIEQTTNHDVKAVEYYLQECFRSHPKLKDYISYIHFACTSEDINNCAHALMLKDGLKIMFDKINQVIDLLNKQAQEWMDIPMMARTHGQPASPTTVGKEWLNVVARLKRQKEQINSIKIMAKINGAVGNFNAHIAAYPEVNWPEFSKKFITDSLNLNWQAYTTQIEPHDYMSELFHAFIRFNTILIDLSRDIWGYISLGYFKQKVIAGEVGSSTMPHKVNPIDFENCEGNLGLSNSMLEHLAIKLPISRWQRDLTDSTTLRNKGTALGYCYIALQAILKGLNKLELNIVKIDADINSPEQWALLGEAIQTVMRKHGIEDAYEQLKAFTRGKQLDKASIQEFINQLSIPNKSKEDLLKLTPRNYLGLATESLKWDKI